MTSTSVFAINYENIKSSHIWHPVLRIRIRRIRMFFGLLDLDPDPLLRGTDPAPAPSGSFYHQAKL
jgi:hypothetical protein